MEKLMKAILVVGCVLGVIGTASPALATSTVVTTGYGTLHVEGSAGADQISITYAASTGRFRIEDPAGVTLSSSEAGFPIPTSDFCTHESATAVLCSVRPSGEDSAYVYGHDGADAIELGQTGDAHPLDEFRLTGGSGDDSIRGSRSSAGLVNYEQIEGGNGDDILVGGREDNNVSGGPGRDVVRGGAGEDYLLGHGGRDRVYGGSGSDFLWGHAGNDLLVGGAARDAFDGGSGDDVMKAADRRKDKVSCGTGRDRFTVDKIDTLVGCGKPRARAAQSSA